MIKKDWLSECLECHKEFDQQTDLQVCNKCMNLFDTDKLWRLHDSNKLDALDFNESSELRERFRIKKLHIEVLFESYFRKLDNKNQEDLLNLLENIWKQQELFEIRHGKLKS